MLQLHLGGSAFASMQAHVDTSTAPGWERCILYSMQAHGDASAGLGWERFFYRMGVRALRYPSPQKNNLRDNQGLHGCAVKAVADPLALGGGAQRLVERQARRVPVKAVPLKARVAALQGDAG